MDQVIQFEGTIYENGYGLLPQRVMRDRELPKQSKLIYAYMCSFAGVGKNGERTAFPSVALQCAELDMTEGTYYKWRKPLIAKGYIKITKNRSATAKFENNIYSIVAVPKEEEMKSEPYTKNQRMDKSPSNQHSEPYTNYPSTGNPSTEKPSTENQSTNSNTFTSNSSIKDLDTLDTLDTETDLSITEINNLNAKQKEEAKERYLIESFFENEVIPPNIAKCLKVFSNTIEEAESYSDVIFRAKKAVELKYEEVIWLDREEELERIIINSFTRALRKISKEPVKNPDGYIYKSVHAGLSNHFDQRQRVVQFNEQLETVPAGETKRPKPTFYNWLEERD